MRPAGPSTWLTLLFACVLLAGCLEGPRSLSGEAETDPWADLSPILYDAVTRLHVPVAAPDGKLQDTWVYLPETDDPDARFPVFIDLSPYWKNLKPPASAGIDGGDAFAQYLIDFYVPRGYAVVLASIRGTGDSEGCFSFGGIEEMEAAYAIIDHYATVEWSNGHVGMGGRSYDGTTIQGVAAYKPHEALKLVMPVSGISDLYRYNYRGGVPYFQGPIFNTYYYAGVGLNQYNDVTDQEAQLIVDAIVCDDLPFSQAYGVGTGVTGLYNDWWDERDYNTYAENTQAAFFYIHGFQDWNVKPDHILPWLTLLPDHVPKKVMLHQWSEGTRGGHVFPLRDDWNHTLLRTMDHFLKGIDTGLLDEPMAQIQDSSGLWRHEDQWPPAHGTTAKLYLQDDGTLSWTEGTGGGISEAAGMAGGTLRWTLDLEEELRYAGEPVLHVRLGTSDPEAAWVAQLRLVQDGETQWMNEGVLKARLKDSMYTPTPIVPLQYYDYEIRFYPQDDVFPVGSTLELTLSQGGARFALTADHPAITLLDHAATPTLELPRYGLRHVEDPQPVDMYCWHC